MENLYGDPICLLTIIRRLFSFNLIQKTKLFNEFLISRENGFE